MLGFKITRLDWITFAAFAILLLILLLVYIWIAGLPGRIALRRKHPEAEAVKLLGWAGLLPTVYPWVQALIWAYKPTDVVDIRRFPREEQKAIAEEDARLSRKSRRSRKSDESAKPRESGKSEESAQPVRPPDRPLRRFSRHIRKNWRSYSLQLSLRSRYRPVSP